MSFFSSKSETHAVTLLKQDHRTVEELFKQWDDASNDNRAAEIVSQICQELTIHAEVEERLLYPRVLNAFDDEDDALVREATVEHGTLKGLISLLNGMRPSEKMFDAHVTVLKEYVQHHVKEEENELFPKAEKTEIDMEALGLEIQALKQRFQERVARAGKPQKGVVGVVDVIQGTEPGGTTRKAA